MGLSKKEAEIIYLLAEELTGSSQQGVYRKDVIVTNVEKRISATKKSTLVDYLSLVKTSPEEHQNLISALTIHTTSWFREDPHLKTMVKYIVDNKSNLNISNFKVWSAACSTGEEVYSIALTLEKAREQIKNLNFKVFGTDIDPKSVETAKKAIYPKSGLTEIPKELQYYIKFGTGRAENFFTIEDHLINKTSFSVENLSQTFDIKSDELYDVIFCRNVLIYFSKSKIDEIIEYLTSRLKPEGMLILGHSETLNVTPSYLKHIGRSCYIKQSTVGKRVKRELLIIDDSPTIRAALKKIVPGQDFNVTDCSSAEEADKVLSQKKFDLISLDLNLPGENGTQWLKRHRNEGLTIPIVIISESSPKEAEKIFGALDNGAQDYIVKSELHKNPDRLKSLFAALTENKDSSTKKEVRLREFNLKDFKPEIILIGASTGGPESLVKLLENFTANCPPIVLVQHISHEFAKPFAERIARIAGLKLGSDSTGTLLQNGHIYISQGDYHIEVQKRGNSFVLIQNKDEKMYNHRPAVDKLFFSAAKIQAQTVSILLTGMGQDGAHGLKEIAIVKKSFCIAQDEESSIVFGMPKKAIEFGAPHFVGNLDEIRQKTLSFCIGDKNER